MCRRRISLKAGFRLFCMLLAASRGLCDNIEGRVVYGDGSAAAGTVIYMPDMEHRLRVSNNIVLIAEHIPRGISDREGRFELSVESHADSIFFAMDMEDRCVFRRAAIAGSGEVRLVIEEPSSMTVRLLEGTKPVKGQEITVRYLTRHCFFSYEHKANTKADGRCKFMNLMPGQYIVQVIEEVPQVGCCFDSVVTKQKIINLESGKKEEIELGGSKLPCLKGKIADSNGEGLHGVWVHLESTSKEDEVFAGGEGVVFSDVTEKDGCYQIYDVPGGEYTLHCFRRLLLNNYGRVLKAERDVRISDREDNANNPGGNSENTCNVEIELEPFMPLSYGQKAPEVKGQLLSGESFSLGAQSGVITVLYFYTSWCSACIKSASQLNELEEKFGRDKVTVVGINLDKSVFECRKFVKEQGLSFRNLHGGAWRESHVRKDYRVINVPTSFIIDGEGKVSQIDVFGKTLEKYVAKLLRNK